MPSLARACRALSLAVVALLVIDCAAQAQSNTQQKPFAPGGRVNIQLESGDYQIKPSTDGNLRVTWRGGSLERPDVKVKIQTHGTTAEITVENTPNNNFHATIEVPPKTDLQVRLTAGDLRLAGITGNKDIESNAGDVVIDVGDASDYARADASVVAGDLSAPAFRVSKGGLFRSFNWTGPGVYSLHVHLMAGDLVLRRGPGPKTAEL